MQGDWAEVSRLAKSPTTVRGELANNPARGELVVRLAHHNRKVAPVRGELVEPQHPSTSSGRTDEGTA